MESENVMSEKKPMLVDIDRFVFGTIISEEPDMNEPGYVKIKYKPLGSFRTHQYPTSIHKSNIFQQSAPEIMPGVERNVVVISGSTDDPLFAMNNIKKLQNQKKELENDLEDMKLKLENANIQIQESQGSSEISKLRESKLNEATKNTRRFNEIGF